MTPPARPVPNSRRDDENDPEPRGGAVETPRGDTAGGTLVWPPPEHELDSLEVISLGPPAAPASAPATAAPRLEVARPLPREAKPSFPPAAPAVDEITPVATSWTVRTFEAADLATGGERWRVPLWATVLLMLASAAAGFAAAWSLR